ncbi:MAG: 4-demethylwyosine synthase TYW1 [Candidatus Heimdallarchaeota archaeon]
MQIKLQVKSKLEKQQYRFIGDHSAVKICGWTKKMIKGEGGCYKLKFYGIMSNQCMQMTTSMSCANRCTFCWRSEKAPVSKDWKWEIDDPREIFEDSQEEHHRLLAGYKGSPNVNMNAYLKSKTVKHVALSLTGEPITYPRINELIDLYHQHQISTFLVTNATYPDQIRDLRPVTQLYISLDAPNKELLKIVDVPLFKDYWERLNQSLDYLASKPYRTCIRLTMIKDLNMIEPQNYAHLIHKGDPDFIEVKAYMHVGASMKRLKRENMPLHEEIIEFAKSLLSYLPEYDIVSEHIPSRVVMLAKKNYKRGSEWYTWIDFPKFHELSQSGLTFTTEDFLRKTPTTGLSGYGTLNYSRNNRGKFVLTVSSVNIDVNVNEKTSEMEFWEDSE